MQGNSGLNMEKPLRITLIGSAPPLRGITSYCFELAKSLSRHVSLVFISFRSLYPRLFYPGGDLRGDPTFPGLEGPNLKIRRVLKWYNPIGWIIVAARIKADVVHIQHWSLPLTPVFLTIMLILKWRRINTVLTLHNVKPHEGGRFYTWCTRLLCRLAAQCVVHSNENARMAAEVLRIPPAKIHQICHGILSFFNDKKGDFDSSRRHLDLPLNAPVILSFGAIRSYKGIDILLRAFQHVKTQQPNTVLVIAGKPWVNWSPYRRLIVQLGLTDNVKIFLDYINTIEVKHFFLAADLVVLPYTHFDAQSGVGAIALAFGKPMIVTTVGALPELVRDPRCRVPPGDIDVLADRIVQLLTEKDFRQQATSDSVAIAKSLSWDKIAEETIALYREVHGS